jgi:hypothetical protein
MSQASPNRAPRAASSSTSAWLPTPRRSHRRATRPTSSTRPAPARRCEVEPAGRACRRVQRDAAGGRGVPWTWSKWCAILPSAERATNERRKGALCELLAPVRALPLLIRRDDVVFGRRADRAACYRMRIAEKYRRASCRVLGPGVAIGS